MALPVIRSWAQTINSTPSTTQVLTAPPTIVAGDLLLTVWSQDGSLGTLTPPTGWSRYDLRDGTSTVAHVQAWSKTATAGDVGAASYSWGTSLSRGWGATTFAISGGALNATSEAVGTYQSTAGATQPIPDITTVVNDCLLIAVSCTSTQSGPATSTPTGWTAAGAGNMATGSSTDGSHYSFYQGVATAGTVTATTWGVTTASAGQTMVFPVRAVAAPSGAGSPGDPLQKSMNRLAGTTGLDAQGAANVWAGTTGLDLLGALNAKNGSHGLGLNAVLNSLAGTTGLDAQAAAVQIAA